MEVPNMYLGMFPGCDINTLYFCMPLYKYNIFVKKLTHLQPTQAHPTPSLVYLCSARAQEKKREKGGGGGLEEVA